MRISFSACKQTPPLQVTFPGGGLINMDQLIIPRHLRRKDKVVVVVGATGTGKSRLSIDIATRFDAEIINSDKMQVYRGLDVITNKVTDEECRGVAHHLLGVADPDSNFTADDFARHASLAVMAAMERGRLPVIAGGSNSFVKALVCDDSEFRSRYECCFLWVDVKMSVLHSFVSERVDQMAAAGLVEEAREFYDPDGDYSRGIRQAIGVPELDEFFRSEESVDAETRAMMLESAVEQIKANTRNLACRQVKNILQLEEQLERRMHRLHATEAFLNRGKEPWERLVVGPSTAIVGRFLCGDHMDFVSAAMTGPPPLSASATAAAGILGPTNATAVAAATH